MGKASSGTRSASSAPSTSSAPTAKGRYSDTVRNVRNELSNASKLRLPRLNRDLEYFEEANKVSIAYNEGAYISVLTSGGEIRGNVEFTDKDVRIKLGRGSSRVLTLDELKTILR